MEISPNKIRYDFAFMDFAFMDFAYMFFIKAKLV